jgi:vacuolar-type H+-ATPase subunit D/Vma8
MSEKHELGETQYQLLKTEREQLYQAFLEMRKENNVLRKVIRE